MTRYLQQFYFVIILFSLGLVGCKQQGTKYEYALLQGETMGTYYRVTCNCTSTDNLKDSIDVLLLSINQEVSTYIPTSYISLINAAQGGTAFTDWPVHFRANLQRALYWYQMSRGYMDVSIQPMVNYWGFGYSSKDAVTLSDSMQIDSLRQYTGLSKWDITEGSITKRHSGQKLGFAAIAKGYAVDEVALLLGRFGCKDYLVDIGGEGKGAGVNQKGTPWTLGVSTPTPEADMRDVALFIRLDNKALATSGNYRNYHKVSGRIYGHTIDPLTGYPYQDELLAATILTEHSIDADAIATACMAMGYSKAATFISGLPEVDACFLVGTDEGIIEKVYINGFIQHVISEK